MDDVNHKRTTALGPSRPEAEPRGRTLRDELERGLMDPEPVLRLEELRARGIISQGLPEVEALAGLVPPEGTHHKDIWEHTVQVVAACPSRPALRWAALLHDVGKVPTRRVGPGGEVSFHGHEEAGARMVEQDIVSRLGFGVEEAIRIASLVRHHHRAGAYHEGWSESAVRRLCVDLGDLLDDLLALARADVTSRQVGRRMAALGRVDALEGRIRACKEAMARPPLLPSGLGRLLMERFGLGPGPEVGRLRRLLEDAVRGGAIAPGATAEELVWHLERSGLGFVEPRNDGTGEAPGGEGAG